jgi:hypothetical protein
MALTASFFYESEMGFMAELVYALIIGVFLAFVFLIIRLIKK